MKDLNKYILTLLISSFLFISCKEEILIEPSETIGVSRVTSDNNIPYVNIPFESIFTVEVTNPKNLPLYGNVKEFKDGTGQLIATIVTNPNLLDSPTSSNKIYIKVAGTPKDQEEKTIKIKLTKNDSLYGSGGNQFIFKAKELSGNPNSNNLFQKIKFFEELYKANRNNGEFLGKNIKISDLNKTYERAFLATKLLSDATQQSLLNDAIEAQNEFNRIKNSSNEDFSLTIKEEFSQLNLEILNNSTTNYFKQVIRGIIDDDSKEYKTDIRISLDPTSWIRQGVEKKPLNSQAVKLLLASLTEQQLKDAQDASKNLDSSSFDLGNQNFTEYASFTKDSSLIAPIIGNFIAIKKSIFPIELNVFFKMGKGFLVNYPESFLKQENEIVVIKMQTKEGKKYKLLYKVAKSKIDPNQLIYQAHFKEE